MLLHFMNETKAANKIATRTAMMQNLKYMKLEITPTLADNEQELAVSNLFHPTLHSKVQGALKLK